MAVAVITSYRPVPEQTDSSPFITSTGERVRRGGIAVSQDLLCPAALFKDLRIKRHKRETCHLREKVHYGDRLKVEGFKQTFTVFDCMNKRHKKRVDILVFTYEEEKAINVKTGRVWRVN